MPFLSSQQAEHVRRADCFYEIDVMITASVTCKLLDFFAVVVVNPASPAKTGEVATFTLKDEPFANTLELIHYAFALLRGQIPVLDYDWGWLVIKNGQLSIGRLTRVVYGKALADA